MRREQTPQKAKKQVPTHCLVTLTESENFELLTAPFKILDFTGEANGHVQRKMLWCMARFSVKE